VSEAGGRVTDMKGDPLNVTSSDHLLADNGALHEEVLEAFRSIFGGTLRVPLPSISF
jgi:fructose-1,6-bisphosphatase/inositol monophosphatase family enzyme